MPLLINLRDLERDPLDIEGELTAEELEMLHLDELMRMTQPLEYELEVERLDDGILVQGRLRLELDCECARCLKRFAFELNLEAWAAHLPLEGEDAVPVNNDSVDLTPAIREDILLELPQRPLCKPDCAGLLQPGGGKTRKNTPKSGQTEAGSSPWAELNKLKL
jgi:uncharacterized protein